MMKKCLGSTAVQVREAYNTWLGRFDSNEGRPFYPATVFPYANQLDWIREQARDEIQQLANEVSYLPAFREVSPRKGAASVSVGGWRVFYLTYYGHEVASARRWLPRTTTALDGARDLVSAFVSIMDPESAIPEHKGPLRAMLRVHMGMVVGRSERSCSLTVAGETRYVDEESILVFDDTLSHSAANPGRDVRAALVLDFLRPLPRVVAMLNRAVVRGVGILHPDSRRIAANMNLLADDQRVANRPG